MSTETLRYALSTLAQTCATLVALIGALGLYRLQSLSGKVHDTHRNLRGYLASVGKFEWKPEVLSLLPDRRVREISRNAIAHPENPQQEKIQEALSEELEQRQALGRDTRRTQRLLIFFGGWNLIVILFSLVGFDFVADLSGCWFTSLALWLSAGGTVFSIMFMTLEVVGSLPDWMTYLRLDRVLRWLERRYGESPQEDNGE